MEDLLALIHTLHLARKEAYGMRLRTVNKAIDQKRNFTPLEKNFLNELDGKIDKLDRQIRRQACRIVHRRQYRLTVGQPPHQERFAVRGGELGCAGIFRGIFPLQTVRPAVPGLFQQ